MNNEDDVEIPVEFFDFLNVGEKCETSDQNSSSIVETEDKTENSMSSFVRKSVIQKHQSSDDTKPNIEAGGSDSINGASNNLKQKGK